MIGSGNSNPRLQGVRSPIVANEGAGEPKTLTNISRVQMFLIEFTDANGVVHNTVVSKIGSKIYFAPNAEEWTSRQSPAAPWLQEKFDKRLAEELKRLEAKQTAGGTDPMPAKDDVDILGGGGDAGSAA